MAVLKTKDKSVVKTIGLMGGLGGSIAGVVDIKDGKIVRIRPLHYDWKWKREQIRLWEMKRNGKTLDPGWQELPSPYCLSLQETGVLPQPDQVSPETGGLGPERRA